LSSRFPCQKHAAIGTSIIALAIITIAVVASIGGYFLYTDSQQPDIQITNANIAHPVQSPQSTDVFNQGRVSSYSSFDYVADLPGSYVMTFDNTFSLFSSKTVTLSYSANGPVNQQTFTVGTSQSYVVSVNLAAGHLLNGSFQVSGGSGNDIDFYIVGNTCTESVNFSFVLVNSGSANGYVNVSFQSDGNSIWSNRYYVQMGQQSTENGSAALTDCNTHTFNLVVTQQQKA